MFRTLLQLPHVFHVTSRPGWHRTWRPLTTGDTSLWAILMAPLAGRLNKALEKALEENAKSKTAIGKIVSKRTSWPCESTIALRIHSATQENGSGLALLLLLSFRGRCF